MPWRFSDHLRVKRDNIGQHCSLGSPIYIIPFANAWRVKNREQIQLHGD